MECPICFDEIQQTNACTTPCGHSFCFKCVIKSMQSNEACPCCRTPLVETQEHDEEDDSEYEEDISDESTIESDFEEDDDDTKPDIEGVTKSFITRGYDVKDAMSLLLCRYSKTDAKYTRDYIKKLNDDFDEIMEEIEALAREQSDFAAEDKPAVEWAEEQRIHWHEDNTAVL